MSDANFASNSVGSRRPWGLWIALLVLLLAAAGGSAWWWWRPHRWVDWEAVYSQNNRAIAIMDGFNYLEAVPEFEKVVQMAPDWPAGHINLGITLLNAGSKDPSFLPRCRSVFEELLRRDPDNPYAHFCLGMLLMYQKDGADAMRHFEAVLKVDPNDAYSWYWLGSLNHKDRDKRLHCFEEALKRDKHLSGALYGLAMDLRDADPPRFQALLDESEDLRRSDWRNVSDVKYSLMGHYAEVIGRTHDRPPPSPTGPLVLFQPSESLKVQLAPEAKWAKAADFGSDAVAEVRRLVRARFGATMVVLDYNSDGKPDLYLAGAVVEKGRVRDLLLRNEGGGRFTDVTAEAGLAEPRPTLGCCVGDFDNDGLADLLLTGAGVQKLFRNRGDGTFKDVTVQATLDKLTSVCLGAAFIDLDQDSDLDLLLCEFASNSEDAIKRLKGEKIAEGGLAVYRNVIVPEPMRTPFDKPEPLNCQFRKESLADLQGPAAPAVALALSDMDSDRDLDWLILQEQAAPAVAINDRLLHFRRSVLPDAVLPAASWNGALVLDADHDGRSDLLLLAADKSPQLLANRCRNAADAVEKWFQSVATNAPPLRQAIAVDLNLDSWTDVVGLSRDGLPVLLHNEGGRLVHQSEALGRDADWPRDLVALTVCPASAAGRPDLFIWSEKDGLKRYENRDNGGQGVWVNLLGRNAIDALQGNNRDRCNADGIGVWAVAQSGGVWSGQENTTLSAGLGQSRQPMLFGIARQPGIEVLRLRWPDGTLQAEPNKFDTEHPPPDLSAGKLAGVLQRNRLPGSCPILFAWDGRRFVFVNDFLGAGSIGEIGPDGACRSPRSEESLALSAEQLVPRDGQYVLKITEPMDETTYLDSLQLVVVDQPPGVRVYPEERFVMTGPPPSQQLVAFRKEIYPMTARDQRGRDVTETLRRWDRVAVDDFAKRAWTGFAEEHSIELDFGDCLASFGPQDRLYLCLAGWTEYPFPESSWAAHQAGVHEQWPVLERQDESGQWRSLGESGFPAGMPRMMLVDVTGKLTGPRCRLRLRTNMHVCWDQAFIAKPLADARGSVRATCLQVQQATLAPGHVPAEYSPDGRLPKLYDYHRGVDVPLVGQSGRLTRFGDVAELLHRRDDCFVIFGPGDDLTVRFDVSVLPPLPAGWKRSFVLRTAGYCKDTALSTAHGVTVGPLPFAAMRNYPYGADQQYPSDAAHRDYVRRYLTREVQTNPWPRR